MVFPSVNRDGIWSLILLFTKLSWNPVFHSSRSYIKTPTVFTETWSNSPEIQRETNWSQRIDPKCARLSPDFVLCFSDRWSGITKTCSASIWSHDSQSLTLPIICSTGTCLLWWGEGAVCFGLELEFIFLSDAHKTLIRAWNNHKKELRKQIWPSVKLYA